MRCGDGRGVASRVRVRAAWLALAGMLGAAAAWGQAAGQAAGQAGLVQGGNETVGAVGAGRFAVIDQVVEAAIARGELPGAVVIVGSQGRVVYRKAYGDRSLEAGHKRLIEPMTVDTVFDMASLTKPLMTATAVMQLFEQGRFRLDDPVAKYLPGFAAEGKGGITIRMLLTHYSGLPPDLPLTQPWTGKTTAFRLADASVPLTAPGVQFRYSDINFIVLGELVETLSGESEDRYVLEHVIAPLHLEHTRYLPPASWDAGIAPTAYDEHDQMMRGTVHDPTARRMGGVAGHAGLFMSADDLAVYTQALLDRLAGRPSAFPLSQLTLEKMTRPEQPATGTALRGLGWDIDSPFSGNRGELYPVGTFGHTGFTGTSVWMDPYGGAFGDSYVILLANGVHPTVVHNLTPLRGLVANAAVEALGGAMAGRAAMEKQVLRAAQDDRGLGGGGESLLAQLTGYNESMAGRRLHVDRNGQVLTGIDVLEKERFAPLAELAKEHGGRLRLGLLTNQTGLDAAGRRTIDVLQTDAEKAVPGLQLTTLFSPEHGIAGTMDREGIASGTDAASGLPVVSLYGTDAASRRPTRAELEKLDAVVVDLQDAGVRFYTYETVLGYLLEAAENAGLQKPGTRVIVLDRPDPVTGALVQGPVSDAGRESYTDYMPLPVRHGLTLGELAGYMRGVKRLTTPLTVIEMEGWERGDWFDSTGLGWTNPSPNLRDLTEATLYPGVALVEPTNVSVGRGTDTPFEQVGAPWIGHGGALALAARLNARMLPGVRFMAVAFTPEMPAAGKTAAAYPFAGQVCYGVRLTVVDRNVLDAPEMGAELVAALWRLFPGEFAIDKVDRLLGNAQALAGLKAGDDAQTVAAAWASGVQAFEQARRPYLLY
jgi:uncharacterized protein YbbC (DUF1343 family)/CubicO group peptidase (beta-lactamase class C family)